MNKKGKQSALEHRLDTSLSSRAQRQILRSLSSDPTPSPQPLVDFSSNDYLSFSRSPRLRNSFINALSTTSQSPFGPPSSRLLDGNSPIHIALESQLSNFLCGDAALLFNSGFDANVGLWSCLPDRTDYILYDELIHASTHDGMRASRVPNANRLSFRHNDVRHLRELLRDLCKDEGVRNGTKSVWIAAETLYSMDGDLSPLQEIVEAVEAALVRGNGHMVVDEAHSTGLYGPQGRGLVCALGIANRITVRVHTFGKAMACSGGVVICNPLIRSYLVNYARPLIYSTVMPTMNAIAISKSFEMLERGHGEAPAAHVHTLATLLYGNLSTFLTPTSSPVALPPVLTNTPSLHLPSAASPTLQSTTPILPLLTPRPRVLSQYLISRGFLVRPISYPTVPKGMERVRVCLHAGNTLREVEDLAEAIKDWVVMVKRGEVGERARL